MTDMYRVKSEVDFIENKLNWAKENIPYAHALDNLEVEDVRYLIDTIKQQSEQIKQQAIENERVLSVKDQRINELEKLLRYHES